MEDHEGLALWGLGTLGVGDPGSGPGPKDGPGTPGGSRTPGGWGRRGSGTLGVGDPGSRGPRGLGTPVSMGTMGVWDPWVKDPEYRGPRGSRDEDLNGSGTRGESGTPKGADPEVVDP